jgi:hypothetical protein
MTSASWMSVVQLKWKKVDAQSIRDMDVEMCDVSFALVRVVRALPFMRNAFRSGGVQQVRCKSPEVLAGV